MFVIAGVTGHVGGVAAQQLLAAKQPVKVIVRDAAKGKEWANKGAEVAVGALDDAQFLATTLKGAKGFFVLLPANYATTDFYGDQRRLADSIATAVKQAAVPHVVLLSSVGADMDRDNGPIRGLHYTEQVLRNTGTKLTAIRACYFQENIGQSLAPAKTAGIFPNFVPSADYPMPMIATADIGAQVAKELLNPQAKSDTVDLSGPSYSIRQCAEKLGTALGKQLQIVDIPQPGWVGAMMQGGLSQHVAEVMADMYAGFATGKITPKGDRAATGATPIDTVIAELVR
jgi:uncharacterized protein YbjT (DUF2867 family)